MTIDEFNGHYDHGTKHTVMYSSAHGAEQGIILDKPVLHKRRYKVAIDSYQNMVPLTDIISIKDTKESW
ncbi:hypothetical protein [Pseudoalteromonas sp.]|uniref:hypothetical protein n=1 Tax=Pseudoalteromonas sp. TaxID=53249 RepID=UPI00257BDA46|nr:hypothetical protein [Pseudoalteromonas sp.]